MTNIATPSSRELIGTLDPDVDYGEDGLDGTVAKIEQGLILIERGETRPVLKNAATGLMIRGTGQPLQLQTVTQVERELRQVFASAVQQNWDLIVESLIKIATVKEDVRAHKLLFEYGIGRPREAPAPENPRLADFLKMMGGRANYPAEVEPPPAEAIETTVREIE